jgi:hypothetical protein
MLMIRQILQTGEVWCFQFRVSSTGVWQTENLQNTTHPSPPFSISWSWAIFPRVWSQDQNTPPFLVPDPHPGYINLAPCVSGSAPLRRIIQGHDCPFPIPQVGKVWNRYPAANLGLRKPGPALRRSGKSSPRHDGFTQGRQTKPHQRQD